MQARFCENIQTGINFFSFEALAHMTVIIIYHHCLQPGGQRRHEETVNLLDKYGEA